MDRLSKALMKTGDHVEKQNMIWNMIGSFCYAFASMVLTFLVMRIVGDQQGGIFSFGYSTLGQQLFIVAYFGIRPFQITDGDYEYSFGDYRSHRLLTCACAVAAGIVYLCFNVLMGDYSFQKASVIFLLALYKVIDGFADVYESEFQRNGNLHLTGKSNTFRTVLTVFSFLGSLLITRQLLLSCAVAVAAQLAGVLIFDIHIIRQLPGVNYVRGNRPRARLFQETSLLFLSAFVDFYIFSAAKYAIDANLGDAASGYFNIIFMPTSVINLAAGFVFRPFLTALTEYWNRKKLAEFRRLLLKIMVVIAGIGFVSVAGAALLGKPVLRILETLLGSGYEGSLTKYHTSFVIVVLGGAFFAVMNLLYYALVIMRRQRNIFAIYIAVGLIAFFLAGPVVSGYGIEGAAIVYLLLMILLAAGFTALTLAAYWKGKKSPCGIENNR